MAAAVFMAMANSVAFTKITVGLIEGTNGNPALGFIPVGSFG